MTENEIYINKGLQFENAQNLYSPVEKVAERFPKNTALRFMGANFSYAKLNKNVSNFAAAFKKCGLKAGEAVTFALPNIPESVYLFYAAAKGGYRCSPLHPLSTPDAVRAAMEKTGSRIAFVLSDAAQKIAEVCDFAAVIAVSPANSLKLRKFLYSLKNPLPKQKNNLYRLKTIEKNPQKVVLPNIKSDCPAGENSAVLLQSGGTTGTPKVIGLSAASVNNLARRGLGILGRDKVTDCGMLSVLPVFHGFGLAMGVHAMLCHGGKNVFFPKFSRVPVIKEIGKGNIQFMIGVPRIYEALLSHPNFSGDKLKSLTVAFVGGDFVPRTLLKNFDTHIASFGGKCRLFEGYGLTETVTVCSVNTYKNNRSETVGKPLENIKIEAFDFSAEKPQIMLRGQKGELAISGDTLMTEYLSDEDATKNVFFQYDGKIFVRTGDCGFTDEDGFVHFISRFKRIIKIRGIPVYPMEIEQLVCEQSGVNGACAIPIPSKNGEEQIYLFIESEDPSLISSLPQIIRDKISVFAVPQKIILVKEFPRTNVSKIDTKKLIDEYIG